MTGHTPTTPYPVPTPDAPLRSRREVHDSFGRRVRRATRGSRGRRLALVAGGAAVLVAGTSLAVTTQPAIGEVVGLATATATPTASPVPALRGTDLVRAQAQATIASAQDVSEQATNTDTTELDQQIHDLAGYRTMSAQRVTAQIVETVDTAVQVSDASAAATKHDADERARAAAEAAAAAKAQAAAEEAARVLAAGNTVAGAKATASAMASSEYGWGADQFSCLNSLWTKESGWDYQAYNANGGATGIPQALPGSKMATAGSDWQTNATTQIAWGLRYIKSAYGTPCAAWGHSQASNFY